MKISFYYVKAEYIQYLKEKEISVRGFTTVPNVEYANHNKFVYGVVMKINDIDYYVPITSYKKTQQDNILIKIESHNRLVIRGSMRFNYMIPVPSGCLVPVDFSSDVFTHEDRIMLRKEYKACLHLLSRAQKLAKKTYERVLKGEDEELIRNSCAFKILEEACIAYKE